MTSNIEELVAQVASFDPDTEDYMERLYKLMDEVKAIGSEPALICALFGLLEKYPDVDFGSPGPIVHTLESRNEHRDELRKSISRQPTNLNVWMVNRILNSQLSAEERGAWEQVLRDVSTNPKASDSVKDDANQFLEFQAQRSG